MLHCPECAATLPDAATFCSICGALLQTSPPTISSSSKSSPVTEDGRLLQELRASLAPRYELLKPLGSGGMGAVFLAREPALKRLVAIKVLSPAFIADTNAHTRFEREARAAAALSHPNIVSVYAVGETIDLGLPYIIMQYVDGPPLSAWIQENGKASEREARRILGGVAAALAAAHARGLVHRDVKPGNILLERASNRVLVVDFGLTAALSQGASGLEDTALTAAGTILGTPVYMSPEQAIGEAVTPKSDIYSLGMVAYELLTGQLPFTATSAMGWAAAHLRDTPRPVSQLRPDLSPELDHLVDRCLAKTGAARPTAQEFAEAILPSLEAELPWPPPGLVPLFGSGRMLLRSVRLTLTGLLLLLLALAAPPHRVRTEGTWWLDFATTSTVTGSMLGVRHESSESPAGGTPGWWFAAMILGLAFTLAGSVWLLVRSYPAVRSIVRQRKAGWRWSNLADVLADPDGRSGLLLQGSREMAAIAPDKRASILHARRRIVFAQLLGGVWVLIIGGGWALLAAAGLLPVQHGGLISTLGFWALLLAPPAIAWSGAIGAGIAESQLFGVLPRRRTYTGTFLAARPVERSDDAAAWYARLPGEHLREAPGPTVLSSALNTAYLLFLVVGSAALLALIMTAAATVVAARTALRLGPETAEAATLLEQRESGSFWGQARDTWSAYLPQRDHIPNSAKRTLVRRLIEARGTSGALPSYPVEPREIISAFAGDTLRQGIAAVFQSGFRELSADTVRLLESLSQHPRTTLVRRIARASGVDIFGSTLDRPIMAYGMLDSLPQLPYGLFRSAAQANVLGALLAKSRGDDDAIAQRLGENAALAEHFLSAPSLFANRYGVGMLQQLAILPLTKFEQARGNLDEAQRLMRAGDRMREEVFGHAWPARLAGLAADPHDMSRFSAALQNERLAPGYRVESFYGGWAGFCLNRWEILRGVSPLRETVVLHTADAMTGLPHSGELARLTAKMWNRQSRTGLDHIIARLLWCWNAGGVEKSRPVAVSR